MGSSNVEVDGCVNNNVVADKFADHFCKAYSCNNATRAAELNNEYAEIRATYQGLPLSPLTWRPLAQYIYTRALYTVPLASLWPN